MIDIIKELEGIKKIISDLPECDDLKDEKKVKHLQNMKTQLLERLTKRCDRLIAQQKLRVKMGMTKMIGED